MPNCQSFVSFQSVTTSLAVEILAPSAQFESEQKLTNSGPGLSKHIVVAISDNAADDGGS